MACAPNANGTPFIGQCCAPVLRCGRSFFPSRFYSASIPPLNFLNIRTNSDGSQSFCLAQTVYRVAPPGGSVTLTIDPACGTVTGVVPPDWSIDHTDYFNCVTADHLLPQGIALFNSLVIDTSPPATFSTQFNPVFRTLLCPSNGGIGGSFSWGSYAAPGLENCVIARVGRYDNFYWNTWGNAFKATKGVVFMWGRYRIDIFQIAEAGVDGIYRPISRLISSAEYVAPPLELTPGGAIVWPQPTLTPVVLIPAPNTVMVLYALAD